MKPFYPHSNGEVYGGGERTEENQMPVEESGNQLLLFGAIAKMEGKPDFANLNWSQLTRWAEYVKEKGFVARLMNQVPLQTTP